VTTVPAFRDWLIVVLQVISLFGIVFSAIKIINKNEREWSQRDERMMRMENEILRLMGDSSRLISVEAKLAEIATEMSRVRDRLDRFLDTQSASR
jgi:hypothetical protein